MRALVKPNRTRSHERRPVRFHELRQRTARGFVQNDRDLAGTLLGRDDLQGGAVCEKPAVHLSFGGKFSLLRQDGHGRELGLRLVAIPASERDLGGRGRVPRKLQLGPQEVELLGDESGQRNPGWIGGRERRAVERHD